MIFSTFFRAEVREKTPKNKDRTGNGSNIQIQGMCPINGFLVRNGFSYRFEFLSI